MTFLMLKAIDRLTDHARYDRSYVQNHIFYCLNCNSIVKVLPIAVNELRFKIISMLK